MSKKLDLLAYGPIGGWFGVSAQDLAEQLHAAPDVEEITIRVHSEGGDALDGIAISNMLRAHPAKVVCYVDGLCASAASMLAMGADEVVMAENAVMMLHSPWGAGVGDGADLREQADVLDTLGRAYVAGYARKTGRAEDEIRELMARYSWRTGTWMTAADALREKLADRVGPPVQAHARAGALRAAAIDRAPAPLKQILAGSSPATTAPQAGAGSKSMTLQDWVARLKAATTDAARAAIYAEMEEHKEPDGDEAKAETDEEPQAAADEDDKGEDDDEKAALKASVAALQEQVRDLGERKAAAQLTPEQWTDAQVKAGYPASKRAELLALRQKRPNAAAMAAQTVLAALPQQKRQARLTQGGAPLGTTPEQAQPGGAIRTEARASAEKIMSQAQARLTGRTGGLAGGR